MTIIIKEGDSMKIKKSSYYIVLVLLIVLSLVFLPYIINYIYSLGAPTKFFSVPLDVSDFLTYYASVLTFSGTLILGILTLVQNRKAQDKTDEINQLQLELQKRSMEIAEEKYEADKNSIIPKFNIAIAGYSGNYLNPRLKIENVSGIAVSNFCFISAYVKDNQDDVVRKVTDAKIKNKTLLPYTETILDLKMLNLTKRISNGEFEYFKNIDFVLEFSCEDEKYNKHYFRAILNIPSSKDFIGDSWKVEKVG